MKKRMLSLLIPLCLPFLVGCGNGGSKLPSTNYEKVQFALNGVEKSLTNQKGAKKKINLSPKGKRSEAEAIDAIYNIFPEGTASQPDFKYDEPPMIQFLYIKKTLEKIGSGIVFGAKYQETITGSIYYDFSTGKDTQEAAFKQDYSLNFSLYINIDDNDLINCKTLFDVSYTHSSDVHHQTMYADLFLDYDMAKQDANYKLKLFAADDCSDFRVDEEKYFSAEYDYVDVSNDAINEWGKIGYSANKAIVLDNGHDSLSDYLSDGNLKFKPTIQLYRNGMRYQRNQLDDAKTNQIVTIACDELGVNGTDIKYKEYISQPATNQPVLKTCFDDFSNIYGRDLMYNIVYTGAKEEGGQQGGGGDQDRVDSSWPTQGLIDDGYADVPGFLSKTATFTVTRDFSTDTNSYSYIINVLNHQSDDFDRFERALTQKGFTITKNEAAIAYIHNDQDGKPDYAVSIYRMDGSDMILVGMLAQDPTVHEKIIIQNANDYTGDYSSYKEITYQVSSEVANIVESVSGGRISASAISQYAIAGSSKSYEIKLDKAEFSSDDLNRNASEYAKTYSSWSIIDPNGAFYTTVNGIDILVMIDKNSSSGTITVHSFAFAKGSINNIVSGQGGGQGSESSQGGGQQVQRVTVRLYEVNPEIGAPEFVESYVFNEGESIDVMGTFGPGEYFEDPGCAIAIADSIIARDGLSIYRKIASQGQTQGSIVIMDANTKEELFTYTDVIGATVKGGQIYSFVLYKDANCGTKVGLDEEITISEETLYLYCQDSSKEDYVTLTVNTYINGVLSPYRTKEFGIRKGKIMDNYSSYSFPVYYDTASYFDPNFTMKLSGKELGNYSQDLIALTENANLDIYCTNEWCKVYHIKNGDGEIQFDYVWEGGDLTEGSTFFYGSKFYHISYVSGDSATYDSTEAGYTYYLCKVFNGKVITTDKEYFAVQNGQGMSIGIDPDSEPVYFLDIGLKTPLLPEQGQTEVMFKNSFTLYTRFTR